MLSQLRDRTLHLELWTASMKHAGTTEVTQRIEIDGHALDFALGADVEHREFVLLESPRLPVRHDYSLRVVVYYGEDGRRLREWSLPPACPMDGCFQPGCCNHEFLAGLENLLDRRNDAVDACWTIALQVLEGSMERVSINLGTPL